MKKFISTILFSLFAVIACAFTVGAGELTASATNDFSISVTELEENEGMNARPGDFKVTLSIANNSGIAGCGFSFYYDKANFDPVIYLEGDDVYVELTYPSAWNLAFVALLDASAGHVGISGASQYTNSHNTEMLSFYLRPKNGNVTANPLTGFEVDQVRNVNKELQSYTEPTGYVCNYISTSYVIGDVDGDGLIDSADAIIVMEIVEANGDLITLEDFSDNEPFAAYDSVVCIAVVDVDCDNDVDNDDAEAILTYYSTVGILGNTYNGVIGTTGYYYTVVYSFTPTAA